MSSGAATGALSAAIPAFDQYRAQKERKTFPIHIIPPLIVYFL
jgi:hypothetical protein